MSESSATSGPPLKSGPVPAHDCLRESLPDVAALNELLEACGAKLRAVAGGVWFPQRLADGQTALRLVATWGRHAALADPAGPQREDMQRAAADCSKTSAPLLLMPHVQAPERNLSNRSPEALVSLPWRLGGTVSGVLQWWAEAGMGREELTRRVEELQAETVSLGPLWQQREMRMAARRAQAQAGLLDLASDMAAVRDAAGVAQLLAVHALALLGGERSTVLVRSRGRWKVLAVSGQDSVDKRGAHAQAAVQLAESMDREPEAHGTGLRFLEGRDGWQGQAVLEWGETGSKDIWGLIWVEATHAKSFEFFQKALEAQDGQALAPVQILRRMAAPALRSALALEQSWLGRRFVKRPAKPSFEAGGSARRWIKRLVPVILIAVAAWWPVPVKLEADCMVRPVVRGYVAAEVPGRVDAILVREGDEVREGQVVARLDTTRLETELAAADQLRLRHEGEVERHRGKGEEALARVAAAQARAATAECDRLRGAIQLCQLKTPVAGVVVTRDLHLLAGVYLEAGQNLAEVAGTSSWNLRLDLREQDLGPLAAHLESGGRPEVRYILHTLSSEVLSTRLGGLDEVGPMVVHEGGRGVIPVIAGPLQPPPNSAIHLRSGLSGRAVVVLPSRPALWVMTRGFLHWLRLRWWI
ncbi:MAG: biotin/lipoyl-binding protein [Verrucomicrobiaceae bacterium]|nr:biotin/lipoyl-binding protein [Verrucomicrobiaceae bacterium]